MPELDLGSVIGPQGPKGDKGIDGAVGPMGPQGEKGDDGAAASINGVNALTIEAGDGLEAEMSGGVYRLKMAGGSDIAAHIARTDNPHGVTAEQVGAAPSGHTHDERYHTKGEVNNLLAGKAASSHTHPVGNITGVLPVSKGGTGQTSLTALMSAMGAGKIVVGTYTGNGNESMAINLGFTPKAVLLLPADNGVSMLYECYDFNNNQYSNPRESALCIQGQTILNGSYKVMSVKASGFTVYCYLIDAESRYQTNYYCRGNESGKKFNYVAFG